MKKERIYISFLEHTGGYYRGRGLIAAKGSDLSIFLADKDFTKLYVHDNRDDMCKQVHKWNDQLMAAGGALLTDGPDVIMDPALTEHLRKSPFNYLNEYNKKLDDAITEWAKKYM